jgi:hypothetical protein
MQKAQQGHGPAKRFQFTYRTIEVGIARGAADLVAIATTELTPDRRIYVAKHRVLAEGAQARAVNSLDTALQTCPNHGFRGMTVRPPHPLAQRVKERVVKIEDDAADDGVRLMFLSR